MSNIIRWRAGVYVLKSGIRWFVVRKQTSDTTGKTFWYVYIYNKQQSAVNNAFSDKGATLGAYRGFATKTLALAFIAKYFR